MKQLYVWLLHTANTPEVTFQHIHQKYGKESMDANEILPSFSEIAMHAGWKSYYMHKFHNYFIHSLP
ncbi:hypothetical protein [Bacillus cereus group sp. N6]|uniref:hypothetical protein n=1 Tax=Bacillus cereus group sp. N6 TaxID=2794583 RepID=UPI001F5BA9CD|nr:hypothetical protein [Bacillus cereus group sp. N6]